MKKFFGIFFLLIISIFSCRKDIGPIVIPPVNTPPVSFANDIQPIFNSSCVNCHDENHQYLNLKSCCSYYELLITGTNAPYIDTVNPEQSELYLRLTGAAMLGCGYGPEEARSPPLSFS